MFGSSSPFGQSSSSPFGSQSVFGQTNNSNSNPFAPRPFGSTSPFGSQTGGSIFGGTSTGVFGAVQSSSLLVSTTTFGASSSPAFGSSMPAFGASSTPAFGSSSSSFGGSSVFGQKPALGGFGSTPTQSSPFGSTFQQSQPAFGSTLFGSSTPFGASSQPVFGASSTPAFGSTNTSAFGATSTPAFGATSTPAFGATSTPAFGATASPAFGSTGTAFGASSAPGFGSGAAFGASSTPVFGSSSTPAFGASNATAFGASSTSAFGASSTPAFGAWSTPSFSFGSAPAFGQTTSAFGSSPFGTSTSSFGGQSSPFGGQATTPTFGSTGFGQSTFGGQRGGSRVAPYTPTTEIDGGTSAGTQPAGKLESISAMPVYKDKSHEELRWEDYQLGDKGGPNPAGQSTGGIGFGVSNAQSNPFASSSSTFGQSSATPFSSSTSSNPFAPKTPMFGSSGFGTSSTPAFSSSPFGASSTTNPFGSTSSAMPSLFGTSTPAFGASSSPSLFGTSSSSAFGSSPSLFGSASAQGAAPAFGSGLSFGNTQSSPLFQSTPSFGQSSIFNTPSAGFGGNLFSSTPSLLSTSNPMGFGQTNGLSREVVMDEEEEVDVGPQGEVREELLEPIDGGEGGVVSDVLAREGQSTPVYTPAREVEKEIEREINTDANLTVPCHLGEGEDDEGEEPKEKDDLDNEGVEVDAPKGEALEAAIGENQDILQVSSDTNDDRDDATLATILQQKKKDQGESSIPVIDKGKAPMDQSQVASVEEVSVTLTPRPTVRNASIQVGLSTPRLHPGGRRRRNPKLDDMEQVEGFWVKKAKVPLVKAIYAKYGNITEDCELLSFTLKNQCMNYLVFIVEVLQTKKPKSLSREDIDTIEDGLKDLARNGFCVDWLDARVAPFRLIFKFLDTHMELQDMEVDLKDLCEQRLALEARITDLEERQALLKSQLVAARAQVPDGLDIDAIMAPDII